VPSATSFFLDPTNQLWAMTSPPSGFPVSSSATGGFGLQLSVGEVNLSGGGGLFAAIRDGNNRVWIYNGNTNAFTETAAFAVDIAAGRGEVALRDGNNQIWVVNLASLFAGGPGVIQTAGFAEQMSVGFDTTTKQDFLAYRAGDNSVNFIEAAQGAPTYGASGAFAIDLAAGNQGETFIRDGNNQVHILNLGAVTAGGITFQTAVTTPAFAVQMSVGLDRFVHDDMLAYRAGDNTVHFINFTPAASPGAEIGVGFVDIPGAVAVQVVAGVDEIFIRDTANMVVVYNVFPTGTGTFEQATGGTGVLLRDTQLASNWCDQLSLIDANQHLLVSENNPITNSPDFVDTGLLARDVQGFTMVP
jgi:hypothetical protein